MYLKDDVEELEDNDDSISISDLGSSEVKSLSENKSELHNSEINDEIMSMEPT
jgi:hypothetical protein